MFICWIEQCIVHIWSNVGEYVICYCNKSAFIISHEGECIHFLHLATHHEWRVTRVPRQLVSILMKDVYLCAKWQEVARRDTRRVSWYVNVFCFSHAWPLLGRGGDGGAPWANRWHTRWWRRRSTRRWGAWCSMSWCSARCSCWGIPMSFGPRIRGWRWISQNSARPSTSCWPTAATPRRPWLPLSLAPTYLPLSLGFTYDIQACFLWLNKSSLIPQRW